MRAWVNSLLGRKNPGDDGDKYDPDGYIIKELGPSVDAGLGTKWMEEDIQRLHDMEAGGCSFSIKRRSN